MVKSRTYNLGFCPFVWGLRISCFADCIPSLMLKITSAVCFPCMSLLRVQDRRYVFVCLFWVAEISLSQVPCVETNVSRCLSSIRRVVVPNNCTDRRQRDRQTDWLTDWLTNNEVNNVVCVCLMHRSIQRQKSRFESLADARR